jgi:hypothetical protein
MRTLTFDQLLAELHDLQENDLDLLDPVNDFAQDVGRMRALAELLNARPVPSEWSEFE